MLAHMTEWDGRVAPDLQSSVRRFLAEHHILANRATFVGDGLEVGLLKRRECREPDQHEAGRKDVALEEMGGEIWCDQTPCGILDSDGIITPAGIIVAADNILVVGQQPLDTVHGELDIGVNEHQMGRPVCERGVYQLIAIVVDVERLVEHEVELERGPRDHLDDGEDAFGFDVVVGGNADGDHKLQNRQEARGRVPPSPKPCYSC